MDLHFRLFRAIYSTGSRRLKNITSCTFTSIGMLFGIVNFMLAQELKCLCCLGSHF